MYELKKVLKVDYMGALCWIKELYLERSGLCILIDEGIKQYL